ncbi:MAG: hypothetical protein WCB62_18780 [Pseudolabrys sp.]
MSNISFRHIQADCREPWPNLLNGIKKPPGAAAEIKKSQFTLVPAGKHFAKLGQCLPPDGIGSAVKKNFDLSTISSGAEPCDCDVTTPALPLQGSVVSSNLNLSMFA